MIHSFEQSRRNMVDGQIKTNKVIDPRIVDAFMGTPRERFVPEYLMGVCYIDEDLDLGAGRYLLEPMVLARMLQEAQIKPTDVVLDVGCASGYSTAIAARLCQTIIGLDSEEPFLSGSAERLNALGINNAVFLPGDVQVGAPSEGPYDVILFQGALAAVPEHYFDQLADGGRLLAVLRQDTCKPGQVVVYTKLQSTISSAPHFDAHAPYLMGFEPKERFAF